MSTLRQEFDRVRREFFPRWDTKREWRVRTVSDPCYSDGRCRDDTKTIEVNSGRRATRADGGRMSLTALLIHEIAHAVTPLGHGKRWQARMLSAAERAERLGRKDLADELRADVQQVQGPDTYFATASGTYNRIQDAVCDAPAATFNNIIDFVRSDFGLSRKEFLKRFPRARRVFDAAYRPRKVRRTEE